MRVDDGPCRTGLEFDRSKKRFPHSNGSNQNILLSLKRKNKPFGRHTTAGHFSALAATGGRAEYFCRTNDRFLTASVAMLKKKQRLVARRGEKMLDFEGGFWVLLSADAH
ncbi:MAG: hypothetical protein QM754_17635 [Tepidisphaeraceae bacterium]